ncbi:hypothetical protein [Alteromonas oceanisediminis]|uniref:hypothetical protein n=1 Tax=Alteromonas oceanisediminis TaxID=2836180 RepID=UPI001BD9D401|nr:hypothetical protein [Alteromonas oceanisediminis]MBT0585168.1 hypothetical protein [Alteromonas oceanisediminis]
MKREGHGKKLSYYDWGTTPFFALQHDKRVSYCLFVPETYEEESDKRYELIVLIHGTERGASKYRDSFVDFANSYDCIVLAPLFPVGLCGPGELDNYKLIKQGDFRFDNLLLEMVNEVNAKYRLASEKFFLHGFSGGGHFTHRFFYLHPHRLHAISIGAPGVVTLLDTSLNWWTGVKDIEAQFGISIDWEQLKQVKVQMVVGDQDKQTWEITIPEDSSWWMTGANDAGATRIERLNALKASFEKHSIHCEFCLVPGIAHDGWAVLDDVKRFFANTLKSLKG